MLFCVFAKGDAMVVDQRRFSYMSGLSRRQLVLAATALLLVVALGWYLTVRQAEGMAGMAGTMGLGLGAFLLMWLPMVVAMMFPTVGGSAAAAVAGERAPSARAVLFLVTYLAVWMVFGLAVYLVLAGAERIISIPPENQKWLAAAVYLVAGAYQFVPVKDRCRELCRTSRGAAGYDDVVRTAAAHGLTCIGCCAGFMVVLVAVGMANLLAMALLTVVIFAERFFHARTVSRVAGVVLAVAAVATPFVSWLHPGLPGPEEPMM
jgi:predicted metal-binding membrane protein